MSKIFMNKHSQEMTNGKWKTTETESRYIDEVEYYRITSARTVAFFKALGGTEKLYRENGKVIKLISTNPDKTCRSVYEFDHNKAFLHR